MGSGYLLTFGATTEHRLYDIDLKTQGLSTRMGPNLEGPRLTPAGGR
jgi:hypothetical protein